MNKAVLIILLLAGGVIAGGVFLVLNRACGLLLDGLLLP
jgi:hypothetical protein